MNELKKQLEQDLKNEDARYVYVDTVTNAFIAAQIKGLREERDLSQEVLATRIGTKQSGVSRLERPDYSAWTIETLRKLARAFGVRLRVRFEEFGTLVDEITGFNDKNLLPRKFEDDPIFGNRVAATRSRRFRRQIRLGRIAKSTQQSPRTRRSLGDEAPRKPAIQALGGGHQNFAASSGGGNNSTSTYFPPKGGNNSTGQLGIGVL